MCPASVCCTGEWGCPGPVCTGVQVWSESGTCTCSANLPCSQLLLHLPHPVRPPLLLPCPPLPTTSLPGPDASLQPSASRLPSVGLCGASGSHLQPVPTWCCLLCVVVSSPYFISIPNPFHLPNLSKKKKRASSRKPALVSLRSMLCLLLEPRTPEPAPSRGVGHSLPYVGVMGVMVIALSVQAPISDLGAQCPAWP